MASAIEPVSCIVQATTHLMINVSTLLTTPNCPTTIALGNFERRVAALKKLGPINDEPSPPKKKKNRRKTDIYSIKIYINHLNHLTKP